MDTDQVIIVDSRKHYKLEPGDIVKEGDTYKSASGRYEDPPMKGIEVPRSGHVDYYRPVDNVSE